MLTGDGSIDRLGALAKELGFSRTLLVADAGLVKAGHLEHAHASLEAAGVDAIEFSDFGPNPDADMLEAGRRYAAGKGIDSIIGLGGGSSLDCAKGINFLLTQGGAIHDFQGYGKATKPMLPMIGVPTTAGTGSEAQSYAIISDPRTHRKMACGDPKAAFRAVILDPRLTLTQPASVTAAAGYDAIAHAVESFVCTKRNPRSQELSLEAWRLLEAQLRARAGGARRSRGARRDAAGRVLRGHGDRALDARRHARVRESADRAVRHDARRRHRDPAAARRPLERRVPRNRCTPSLLRVSTARDPLHLAPSALATRLSQLASAGGLPRTLRMPALRQAILRRSPARPRSSGPARSIRARSTPRGRWRFTNARSNRALCVLSDARGRDRVRLQPDRDRATTTSWPQFRANPQLTGVASSPLAPTLKVMWTFDAGEAIESSAAIADGAVYVGSAAGELIALDFQTGAVRWRYKTGEIGESSPAVANGVVYIGDLTGTFHAVDAKTGKALWTFKTMGEIRSSPVVVGDRVLIGSYDRFLYALSAAKGTVAWKVEFQGYVHATPAVLDGVAYISGLRRNVPRHSRRRRTRGAERADRRLHGRVGRARREARRMSARSRTK